VDLRLDGRHSRIAARRFNRPDRQFDRQVNQKILYSPTEMLFLGRWITAIK
jgi:hypothetical protein